MSKAVLSVVIGIAMGMVRDGILFGPRPDAAAARRALASVAMTPADVPEIGSVYANAAQ